MRTGEDGITWEGSDQGRPDVQTTARRLRDPTRVDHHQKVDEFQQSVRIENLASDDHVMSSALLG